MEKTVIKGQVISIGSINEFLRGNTHELTIEVNIPSIFPEGMRLGDKGDFKNTEDGKKAIKGRKQALSKLKLGEVEITYTY